MTALLIVLAALLGLAVGSFLNVVIARVPAGRSVIHPGSACPRCGVEIAPRDNIPVISWLMLRGRCRHCGVAISAQYPLVELATGLWFVAATWVTVIADRPLVLPGSLLLGAGFVVSWVVWERSRRYREGRRSR